MKLMSFKCKVYQSDIYDDFTIDTLHIDIDKISAFHSSNMAGFTTVYIDGFTHDIQVDPSRLAGMITRMFNFSHN